MVNKKLESRTLQDGAILTGNIRHCDKIVCKTIDAVNTLDGNYFERSSPVTQHSISAPPPPPAMKSISLFVVTPSPCIPSAPLSRKDERSLGKRIFHPFRAKIRLV